jgi:hypothetical protein
LNGEPRFAADAMLGRLARWLRVLGYGHLLRHASLQDSELVRLADAEDRILLTRDRHLLRELRPQRAHQVRQDEPLSSCATWSRALALAAPAELIHPLPASAMRCCRTWPPDAAEPLLPEGVRASRARCASVRTARGCTGTDRTCGACARPWTGAPRLGASG